MCRPLQLSPEELARHERPLFRPPEPARSEQTLEQASAADGLSQTEEEATGSGGSEQNVVGAEENTRTQQTPARETLTGDTTPKELSVKIMKAENEKTAADQEESPEEQRYSQCLCHDTQPHPARSPPPSEDASDSFSIHPQYSLIPQLRAEGLPDVLYGVC